MYLADLQSSDVASVEPASKTSAPSSERSGSVDSESRRSRTQPSLLPPDPIARRSTSPGGRIKNIFRSKKSNSNLAKSSSPERNSLISTPEEDSEAHHELPPTYDDPPSSKPQTHTKPQRVQPKLLDTSSRPETPPSTDSYGPAIVNTPPTPTEPTHFSSRLLGGKQAHSETGSPPPRPTSSTNSSPNGMITHRRLRSGSAGPSKLSNTTIVPLSPTPEHSAVGPGPATPSSGFFSSVISAAQTAATTLSSSIQNTTIGPGGGGKGAKSGVPALTKDQQREPDQADSGVEVKALAREVPEDQTEEKKEPAVKTLGTGDLSLSQLGLSDPALDAPTPTAVTPETQEQMGDGARTRSESTPVEPSPSFHHFHHDTSSTDDHSHTRSQSLYDHPAPLDSDKTTPPAYSFTDEISGLSGSRRSGSVRSAIGRRRKRGSSTATGYTANTERTGTTIGAAIVAANASFAHPRGNQSVPKLTGFAIASKKRNRDFHSFFKSVPDDDYLIEDYSCALQREILAHGRLYVSEGHLCFSSNILGWVTTLVLSFDEIVSVEKRSTALLFKNGLMISTLHNKHIFASFTNRDATYDLIIKIWQLGHPKLQSTLNGIRLEGPGGDKTERIDDEAGVSANHDDHSVSGSEDESDDDIYDEDDESADIPDATQATDISTGDGGDGEKAVARKTSGAVTANGSPTESPGKDAAANGTASADFPGPLTHPPTECGDSATHYDKVVGDEVIPAPLGQVFSMIFGSQSPTWISKFLTENQKCTDLQMDDRRGLSSDRTERSFSYVRPLSGGIGPKQTRCLISESVDSLDWDKAVSISATTNNPDVPSGNVFTVKTKYCLTWAEKNQTRVQVNCTIEWSGKSWIKGPIENGAKDGQMSYCRELFAALRASLESRPGAGPAQKKTKKGRKTKALQPTNAVDTQTPKPSTQRSWGILEPVRSILEPILDILQPILTGNVVYGLLVGLLVAAWFGFGFNGYNSRGRGGYDDRLLGPYGYPDRLVAYEEMWRREESELWEWLEERVGLDRLGANSDSPVRKRVVEPRTVEEKMREERMDAREVEEAIRITEEKLKVLKDMMGKKTPV
ncbi:hypothetical protein jhhlp_003443 [Lomentospora prolificans]|uniref:VASt domain-containing protein n=1 Tax=Lomentospora prolificans TaxID=41688 RepID=A0A2N3N8V0_9PEZI|nr:hypothetical protein jhhlp_003443 [Lomentospora prolificans]